MSIVQNLVSIMELRRLLQCIDVQILFYMFVTTPKFRASNLFYMMCLSVCDVFVSINYIGLFSVTVRSIRLLRHHDQSLCR